MIFVTGGTGLLGSHLIHELIDRGYKIRALRRSDSDFTTIKRVFRYLSDDHEDRFRQIEWVEGDILDHLSLEEAMKDSEHVYHCAALVSFNPKERQKLFDINVRGTANMINTSLMLRPERFCYVGSVAALGRAENDQVIDEHFFWKDSPVNTWYGRTKHEAGMEVWRGIEEGLPAIIVNPSIILGAGNPEKGSTKLISEVARGLKFYPPGVNGFVDVRDVAKAMIELMESPAVDDQFIINAENLHYRELFELIAGILEKSPPQIRASYLFAELYWRIEVLRGKLFGRKPLVNKETTRTAFQEYYYSNDKILSTLGNFKFRRIEEALQHACEVYSKDSSGADVL